MRLTLISDIVHDNDSMGAPVVTARDGPESLLTCRVPDLQLDSLSLELNGTDLEVDSNRRDVGFSVGVICETEEQTGLADSRVSNQKQLEQLE